MSWLVSLLVGAIALAVPAAAQDPASLPGAGTVSAEPQDQDEIVVKGETEKEKKKKRVCRRSTPTGSIMPKTTCHTVEQWEEITAKSVAAVEKFQQEQRTRRFVEESRRSR